MIRLAKSEGLNRLIRGDDLPELGKNEWQAIRDAIKAGRTEEALALADYGMEAIRRSIGSLTLGREMLLSRLAKFGEGQILQFYRDRYTPWVKQFVASTPGPRESMEVFAEAFRTHCASLTYTEDAEKYIMTLNPCATGGLLRQRMEVGKTKTAHPWTWGMKGVSYYCSHCCVFQEILPIEMRGYPICVTEYSADPSKPCVHLYYKKPELIPDEYFTRIGQTPYRLLKRTKAASGLPNKLQS